MNSDGLVGKNDKELLAIYQEQGPESAEAFAELMARHGSMVYQTCFRVIRRRETAEEAAQAAFLVLARKAGSVRKEPGAFLHGVAVRTARHVLREEMVRQKREKEAIDMLAYQERDWRETGETGWDAIGPRIDEAIECLSARQRAAVVLCYLEGKPDIQAAEVLGITRRALRTHMERALGKLRAGLMRRGVAVSAVSLAAMLGKEASAAVACPEILTAAAPKLAMAGASGGSAAGIGANVAKLTEATLKAMMWAKLKLAAGLAAILLTGVGVPTAITAIRAEDKPAGGSPPPPAAEAKAEPAAARRATSEHVAFVYGLAYLDGPAQEASSSGISDAQQDADGNWYVIDREHQAIRVVLKEERRVITLNGNGHYSKGFKGDDGPAATWKWSGAWSGKWDIQYLAVKGTPLNGKGCVYVPCSYGVVWQLYRNPEKENRWWVKRIAGGGPKHATVPGGGGMKYGDSWDARETGGLWAIQCFLNPKDDSLWIRSGGRGYRWADGKLSLGTDYEKLRAETGGQANFVGFDAGGGTVWMTGTRYSYDLTYVSEKGEFTKVATNIKQADPKPEGGVVGIPAGKERISFEYIWPDKKRPGVYYMRFMDDPWIRRVRRIERDFGALYWDGSWPEFVVRGYGAVAKGEEPVQTVFLQTQRDGSIMGFHQKVPMGTWLFRITYE